MGRWAERGKETRKGVVGGQWEKRRERWQRERREEAKGEGRKGTAPGLPTWSPTVVLTWPDNASLHRADGMWCVRRGMAVPGGSTAPQAPILTWPLPPGLLPEDQTIRSPSPRTFPRTRRHPSAHSSVLWPCIRHASAMPRPRCPVPLGLPRRPKTKGRARTLPSPRPQRVRGPRLRRPPHGPRQMPSSAIPPGGIHEQPRGSSLGDTPGDGRRVGEAGTAWQAGSRR